MDLEDRLAFAGFRQRHHDLAVEATGAQQRGVEDVGAVGGRHDDDAFGGLEAVHLGEQLVERLLPFVVPAAESGASLAADRVDLVDEDDGPTHPACLLEQVANTAGADTDEHLHEVRAGDAEEPDARLARHSACEQGLAGAWRADEQDALGNPGADLAEAVGHAEEVDHLGDLLLHPGVAGDVVEGGRRLVGVVGLGLAAPDGHHAAHLALRAALHPDEESDDQQHGQEDRQHPEQPVAARLLELERDVVVDHQPAVGVGDAGVGISDRAVLVAVGELAGDLGGPVVDDGGADLALDELCAPLGVFERLTALARPQTGHEERGGEHADEHPDRPLRPASRTAA